MSFSKMLSMAFKVIVAIALIKIVAFVVLPLFLQQFVYILIRLINIYG